MAKRGKRAAGDEELLGEAAEPGSYEWAEEVVQYMNAAWRTREQAEAGFLDAVRAALQYRIWEVLSPPFPEEPYGSLDGLLRRRADPEQVENMQIAIRFSGVLNESGEEEPSEARSDRQGALAAGSAGAGQSAAEPVGQPAGRPTGPERVLNEEEEIALGNRLLEAYAAGLQTAGPTPWEDEGDLSQQRGLVLPPGEQAEPPQPRTTPAQRKRDRLERTHPELAEAVEAGEITLKQAYVKAGIEREVRTIDKLQRLWQTASEEERDRFLAWLDEQEQRRQKQEYEEEVYGEE